MQCLNWKQQFKKKPIIKDPYDVNIGLGREGGKALNIFNDNIIDYKVIGE